MEFENVIYGTNIRKSFKGFDLDVEELRIPKGFATALIGENGAGKTTLLRILAGIWLDYTGKIQYFDEKLEDVESVKERLGYTGPNSFFLPQWTIPQIEKISGLLFDNFDSVKYRKLCQELSISAKGAKKKVNSLSDGNKMKLELAAVFARDVDCLLMDEPASPLDPLMRDTLCGMIHEYIEKGNGEKSVFFSTHNITDMENVTDYAIIMDNGKIAEQGFVEDLKEKYILVKGETGDVSKAEKYLYSFSAGSYGFEGLCLAKDLDKLAGLDISRETPSLFQISVAVMKAAGKLRNQEGD